MKYSMDQAPTPAQLEQLVQTPSVAAAVLLFGADLCSSALHRVQQMLRRAWLECEI